MKQGSLLKALACAAFLATLAATPAIAKDTKDAPKQEALYPNATRAEPKLDKIDQKEADSLDYVALPATLVKQIEEYWKSDFKS